MIKKFENYISGNSQELTLFVIKLNDKVFYNTWSSSTGDPVFIKIQNLFSLINNSFQTKEDAKAELEGILYYYGFRIKDGKYWNTMEDMYDEEGVIHEMGGLPYIAEIQLMGSEIDSDKFDVNI